MAFDDPALVNPPLELLDTIYLWTAKKQIDKLYR